MSTAAAARPRYETAAEAVYALGDIPLHRILWYPAPGTATEEDQLRLIDGEPKLLVELLDGILVLKAIDRDSLKRYVPDLVTMADVVDQLGGIPLDRILWEPPPGTATEADALRLVNGEPKRLVELIDGTLVEKPMGNRESLLAGWLVTCLNMFVVPRRLGVVGAPDALMRIHEDQLRLPDVYFKAWATLPFRGAHRRPVAPYAPDLAVEVLSDTNTRREIDQKRREFFAAGTQLVWIVDPRTATVAVYTDPDTHALLTVSDTLTGDPVLPGFALPVADIFGYLDEPDTDLPADR